MMKRHYFYSAEVSLGHETLWAHGYFSLTGLFPPMGRALHDYAIASAHQALVKHYGELPDKPIRILALNRL